MKRRQPKYPAAPDVFDIPVSDLIVDERRFQTRWTFGRSGVSGQLLELERFGRESGGVLSVWFDPDDGHLYVVDGHNRLDLAERSGEARVRCQYIEADNAEEARLVGALINMRSRTFGPFDVAAVMRSAGWTAEDLRNRGVALRDRQVKQGTALARLAPEIFRDAAAGKMKIRRAVTIGELLDDYAQQRAVVKLLRKRPEIGDAALRELIESTVQAETKTGTTGDLFGAREMRKSLAVERAQVAAEIRSRMQGDRRLFSTVARSKNAARLASAGSKIDTVRGGEEAHRAAQLCEQFDRLRNLKGPVSDLINHGANRVVAGTAPKSAANAIYREICDELLGNCEQMEIIATAEPVALVRIGITDKGKAHLISAAKDSSGFQTSACIHWHKEWATETMEFDHPSDVPSHLDLCKLCEGRMPW